MANFNPITFAKGVLRRASPKCPAHWEALHKARKYYKKRNKDGSISKRKLTHYKCANCNRFYKLKEIEVDHIEPIGIYQDFTDWVVALLMGERQVLCIICHKKKTGKDKKLIKEAKKKWRKTCKKRGDK